MLKESKLLGISKEVGTPRYLTLVVSLKKIGDEAVHKELGDRIERAATTTSSLEAKQDSGNINSIFLLLWSSSVIYTLVLKQILRQLPRRSDCLPMLLSFGCIFIHTITQCLRDKSTAWNEFSSSMASLIICLATNQKFNLSKYIFDVMRAGKVTWRITPLFDTMMVQPVEEIEIPQVEAEHEESTPTPSNDPQPSGDDSMQLTDLMVLCTELQTQVLDLQKAKDDQTKEIAALKKRIQRVESSEDQESLGAPEDASKQGRSIEDIDVDVDVSLVDETQERQDDDLILDTRVLEDNEMHVEAKVDRKEEQSTKPDDNTAGEAVTTASVDDSVVPTTIKEITLAQTLIQIKAAKPKVVTTAATTTTTTTTRPKDKGVVVQEPIPLKRKDQIALDEQIARDIQAKLDAKLLEEQKLARKQEEEANIALIESWENIQAMMEAFIVAWKEKKTRKKVERKQLKGSERRCLEGKEQGKKQQNESLKKQKVEEEKESEDVD
ncbi:hypothetical protein Tco_0556192 [Tanacetum coccineum]